MAYSWLQRVGTGLWGSQGGLAWMVGWVSLTISTREINYENCIAMRYEVNQCQLGADMLWKCINKSTASSPMIELIFAMDWSRWHSSYSVTSGINRLYFYPSIHTPHQPTGPEVMGLSILNIYFPFESSKDRSWSLSGGTQKAYHRRRHFKARWMDPRLWQ